MSDDAIERVLREGTYDVLWCSVCGMVADGPWPVGIVSLHRCQDVRKP